MTLLYRLWLEEDGFVLSTELVMVATVVVISMIAAMASLCDQLAQEFADVGQAIKSLDQSYSYKGTSGVNLGFTAGSSNSSQGQPSNSADGASRPSAGISMAGPGVSPGTQEW